MNKPGSEKQPESSFDELALLSPDWFELDFALVGAPVTESLRRTITELERRWPANMKRPEGASIILRSLVAIATNDYRAAMYLCKEVPAAEAAPLEFGLAVGPLVRRVLEALLQIVFLMDDLATNTQRYFQKGWQELTQENALLNEAHGGDPKWDRYLVARIEHANGFGLMSGLTVGENGELTGRIKPGYPSNPGRLTSPSEKKLFKHIERSNYCVYLGKWFYAALSQESHLTFAGVGRQLPVVLGNMTGRDREIIVRRKSIAVGTMLTLLLAILSEIESEFGYGEKQKLIYLWTLLVAHSDESKDLYMRRYHPLLSGHTG